MPQILVVEDEPTVSDVVARYLRREGYVVQTAGDGEEGCGWPCTTSPTWWCST